MRAGRFRLRCFAPSAKRSTAPKTRPPIPPGDSLCRAGERGAAPGGSAAAAACGRRNRPAGRFGLRPPAPRRHLPRRNPPFRPTRRRQPPRRRLPFPGPQGVPAPPEPGTACGRPLRLPAAGGPAGPPPAQSFPATAPCTNFPPRKKPPRCPAVPGSGAACLGRTLISWGRSYSPTAPARRKAPP